MEDTEQFDLNNTTENNENENTALCDKSSELFEKTQKLLKKLKVPNSVIKKPEKKDKILTEEEKIKKDALRDARIKNLQEYRNKINSLKQELNSSTSSNTTEKNETRNTKPLIIPNRTIKKDVILDKQTDNISVNDTKTTENNEKKLEKPEKTEKTNLNNSDIQENLKNKMNELEQKKNNLKSKMVLDEEIKERLDKKMKMNPNKNLKKKISIKYYGDVSEAEMENDRLILEREQNKDLEFEKLKYQQEKQNKLEEKQNKLKQIQNQLFNY